MFVVLDGVDGAGKSTQLEKLRSLLVERGRQVITARDPGSTELGDALRSLLLEKHSVPIEMEAEMLMFTAARAQLVGEIIRPALEAGKTVLLDRYIFSTVVYQGHAGALDPDSIWKVNWVATRALVPDLTLIFDLPLEIALSRMGEELDRMESRGPEYLEKVRNGFLREAGRFPQGVEVLDATCDIDALHRKVVEIYDRYDEPTSN